MSLLQGLLDLYPLPPCPLSFLTLNYQTNKKLMVSYFCRLASLPPLFQSRPCLGCSVPIPANSHDLHCGHCRTQPPPRPLFVSRPCYDCGTHFPAPSRVIRCFDCRSRRSTIIQAPIDYGRLCTTTFDPFVNSFQRPRNTGEPVLES